MIDVDKNLRSDRWFVVLVVATVVAMTIRLWFAWQPIEELVWRFTADDAYYYLKIAESIAAGAGATFDGIHQTNGFHPLFALLLVPIVWAARGDLVLTVHLSLTLIALFSVGSAWIMFGIGHTLRPGRTGVIGAAMILFNPGLALIAMTGVESAVYLFTLALLVLAYLHWRRQPSVALSLQLGVAMGLALMARSEAMLLIAGIGLEMVWVKSGEKTARWRQMGLVALSALLVCLPWVMWSTANFGTPFQVSGAAVALINHQHQATSFVEAIQFFASNSLWYLGRYFGKLALFSAFPLGLGLLMWWLSPLRKKGREPLVNSMQDFRFVILPMTLLIIFYNFVLWNQQHWYFTAPVFLLSLLAMNLGGPAMDGMTPAGAARMLKVGYGLGVLALAGGLALFWGRGLYHTTGQHIQYRIGAWIAGSDLSDKHFAAPDSGIVGYFCHCTLTNLDGVVNNSAHEFYLQHGGVFSRETIGAYLLTEGVDYIALSDDPRETTQFGPAPIHWVVSIPNTNYNLYQIVKQHESTTWVLPEKRNHAYQWHR